MPASELRLIKRCAEYLPQEDCNIVPRQTRGIYILLHYKSKHKRYDVVYVGMTDRSIRGRLGAHLRKKRNEWTHFSIFEVWDNIREEEIKELEGIFRHIYKDDTRANRLNRQRGFKKLKKIKNNMVEEW